jgi:hypothetical protein
MLKDLKLGQYVHLAPKCTFAMQIIGTVIGCCMSYVMMQKITTEKREILLAIQGTNVWSGQLIQGQNSAAITWGGLAKYIYSVGGRYQWVSLGFLIGLAAPFPLWFAHKAMPKLHLDYWNTAIITAAMGALSHGTHSAFLFHYLVGFFSQLYLRKYRTNWFIKYNYILSAGMDGGSAVINFILTFTVFGAGGKVVPFPPYWVSHSSLSPPNFHMTLSKTNTSNRVTTTRREITITACGTRAWARKGHIRARGKAPQAGRLGAARNSYFSFSRPVQFKLKHCTTSSCPYHDRFFLSLKCI